MAGPDEERDVGVRGSACSIVTRPRSGRRNAGEAPEPLDEREDVVPASAVETRRVVAQLPEDLVHLERAEDRLDEDGRADRPVRDAEILLRLHEDVVPETRLEVALELGEVEVRPRPLRQEASARCGRSRGRSRRGFPRQGLPSTRRCFSRRCQPRGRTKRIAVFSLRRYALPLRGAVVDRPVDGVAEVALTLDAVRPRRRVGVLEVGHEDARAGVQRVDDHLPVDRTGDLHAAVVELRRNRRDLPLAPPGSPPSPGGSRGGRRSRSSSGASTRRASSSSRRAPNVRWREATKRSASGVRISSYCSPMGPRTSIPSVARVAMELVFGHGNLLVRGVQADTQV